jgi:phage recombination protein Bet
MNELRTTQPHGVNAFTPDQVSILKSQIAPGASDDELKLFIQVCQRTGLDPFARQIYAVVRNDKRSPTGKKMTIQTSIDGFRLIAQRSKEYAGQAGPFWCGSDGAWKDVWLTKDYPVAAKVGIYRKGFSEPIWGVALWSEFCQMYFDKVSDMWKSLPTVMIAKCAESQGLRRAFPQELSGIYSEEEMAQADNPKEDEYEWTDEDRASVKLLTQDLGQIFMDVGLTEEAIAVILDPSKSKQMNSIGDPSVTYNQWANRWVKWSSDQIKKHCPAIESKPTQTEEAK